MICCALHMWGFSASLRYIVNKHYFSFFWKLNLGKKQNFSLFPPRSVTPKVGTVARKVKKRGAIKLNIPLVLSRANERIFSFFTAVTDAQKVRNEPAGKGIKKKTLFDFTLCDLNNFNERGTRLYFRKDGRVNECTILNICYNLRTNLRTNDFPCERIYYKLDSLYFLTNRVTTLSKQITYFRIWYRKTRIVFTHDIAGGAQL